MSPSKSKKPSKVLRIARRIDSILPPDDTLTSDLCGYALVGLFGLFVILVKLAVDAWCDVTDIC